MSPSPEKTNEGKAKTAPLSNLYKTTLVRHRKYISAGPAEKLQFQTERKREGAGKRERREGECDGWRLICCGWKTRKKTKTVGSPVV